VVVEEYMTERGSALLIEALQQPESYLHAVADLTVIETHISWLVLTGTYAYKIKKPLNLGFLDFSTLEKRCHYCHEELRLNRRLAPEIYLEVVAITGNFAHPCVGGSGTPLEYAVKMRQFPQQGRLDHCLQRGEVSFPLIARLAHKIATFHETIAIAPSESIYGAPDTVLQPARENFEQMNTGFQDDCDHGHLTQLQQWTHTQWQRLRPAFLARKAEGFIRECHGDLHLANIALMENNIVIFDCIEFNENLRWIDVMSELAFLVMDLEDRGRSDLAWSCLNSYLEHQGDYQGLAVFRYYQVYRALVRAKVAAIRLGQTSARENEVTRESYRSYLNLALSYTRPVQTPLIITHGLSGSGKTTLSHPFVVRLGAIRLRSDIERKRLQGLKPLERRNEGIATGIYSAKASQQVYQHLQQLATMVLKAGYPAVVDATFLSYRQRQPFQNLAQRLGIPFAILDFRCPLPQLQQRVRKRHQEDQDASDADLAVLAYQQSTQEPLTQAEQKHTLAIETSSPLDFERLIAQLQTLIV
jgi:uncharacterized protein